MEKIYALKIVSRTLSFKMLLDTISNIKAIALMFEITRSDGRNNIELSEGLGQKK